MSCRSCLSAFALIALVGVTGCGQAGPSPMISDSSPPSSAPQVTPSESPRVDPEPSETAPGDAETDMRTPVPPVSGTRTLTLADAFNPGDWTEGSFTPTNQPAMQAMGAKINCYSDEVIEYRFSRASGQLVVSVAQDSLSDSSDATLEWGLIADGRQIESKTIAFKEVVDLKADLSGVAVVKISVHQKDSNRCSGSAGALITRILITA